MMLQARDVGLSIHGVFAPLPSGHLLALGTRALLGLCAVPGQPNAAPLLCTGYHQKGSNEPHRKFLRTPTHPSALKFELNAC